MCVCVCVCVLVACAQVELLSSILDSEHIHSRELRNDQDILYVDPMKK